MLAGASWRQEQAYRRAIIAGHTAARLTRAKTIPPLRQLLPRDRGPQGPAAQAAALKAWAVEASRQGLAVRVGRADDPFVPFDLEERGA